MRGSVGCINEHSAASHATACVRVMAIILCCTYIAFAIDKVSCHTQVFRVRAANISCLMYPKRASLVLFNQQHAEPSTIRVSEKQKRCSENLPTTWNQLRHTYLCKGLSAEMCFVNIHRIAKMSDITKTFPRNTVQIHMKLRWNVSSLFKICVVWQKMCLWVCSAL